MVLRFPYELLLLLYGASQLALRPSLRGAIDIERILAEDRAAHKRLRRLEADGWIETAEQRGKRVLRLTAVGRAAFGGGRDPEAAWNRPWDGNWLMLAFDLPREASVERVKFWRWLRVGHFGRLQGSVWITPDPITGLAAVASEAGIDPDLLVVFTGRVESERQPGRMVANAWDFCAINHDHRQYLQFAKQRLGLLRGRSQPPPRELITDILRNERLAWWQAVRRDPFLPKPLLPSTYTGIRAWETRRELHSALVTAIARQA